jgi:hypothetical protein
VLKRFGKKKGKFNNIKSTPMYSITGTSTLNRALRALSMIMIFGLFSFSALAGQTGEIRGTVKDEKGEGIPGAPVKVTAGGIFITSTATDVMGNYSVKNLEAGKYDIEVSSISHAPKRVLAISVGANKTSYVDVMLLETTSITTLEAEVIGTKYEKPIVSKDFSTIKTLDLDQIEKMATATGDVIGMVVGISTDVQPTSDGKGLYMRGSRSNATGMIIDGERIITGGNVPSTAIGGVLVLSGGVPAEYGDFTGGLVVITTKSYTQGMREKRVRNYEAKEKMKQKEAEAKQKKLEQEQKKQEEEKK